MNTVGCAMRGFKRLSVRSSSGEKKIARDATLELQR